MAKDQYTIGHHSQWRDQDTDVRTHILQVNGTIRIEELLGELVARDAPEELYLNNVRIQWEDVATLEALEERERTRAESARRQEMWERKQLASLMAKYGINELEEL